MKAFIARNGIYVAVAMAVALAVHAATLLMLPHVIMARAMQKIAPGGRYNTLHHAVRADDRSRLVVRPSPDLLYSICPFDLSRGPLRVTADVPPGTYWSVSVFDAETNNIFVENDGDVRDGKLNLVIGPRTGKTDITFHTPRLLPFQFDPKTGNIKIKVAPDQPPADPKEPQYWIGSPTKIGLVLFRTLINDESRFAKIDAARRKATCGVDAGSHSWKEN